MIISEPFKYEAEEYSWQRGELVPVPRLRQAWRHEDIVCVCAGVVVGEKRD